MSRAFTALATFVFGLVATSRADRIVPSDDVRTGVTVRASASSSSAIVAMLPPGEDAELLGMVPNRRRVQLTNGLQGIVRKRWTKVIPSSTPAGGGSSFTNDAVDLVTGLGVIVRGSDFSGKAEASGSA